MGWAPRHANVFCLFLLNILEVFGKSILNSSHRIHKALPLGKIQNRKWQHLSTFLTLSHLLHFLSLKCLFSQSTEILPAHPRDAKYCVLCHPTCPYNPYPIRSNALPHPIFSHHMCPPPRSPAPHRVCFTLSTQYTTPPTPYTHIFSTATHSVCRVKG